MLNEHDESCHMMAYGCGICIWAFKMDHVKLKSAISYIRSVIDLSRLLELDVSFPINLNSVDFSKSPHVEMRAEARRYLPGKDVGRDRGLKP